MAEVLYYPHTHFASREWLRMAFLYHDSLSRIVPSGTDPDDVNDYAEFSSEPSALRDEVWALKDAGFIRDELPDLGKTAAASEKLLAFAYRNLLDPERRARFIPEVQNKRFYTIHPDKIDVGALRILRDLDLARYIKGQKYSEWNIEPVTGLLYMLFLSGIMAGQRSIVTDDPVYQSLLYDRVSPDPKISLNPDPRFQLVTAVFNTVRPAGIEEVPLRKLLQFREKHEDERQAFKSAIRDLTRDLSSSPSMDAVKETVNEHQRKVAFAVKNL